MLGTIKRCHNAELCTECHYAECYCAECQNAECHYAECHYAECHYAECHYTECHYAQFRYAEGQHAMGMLCAVRLLFFLVSVCWVPLSGVIMLNHAQNAIVLSVIMLSVIMLKVNMLCVLQCHFAELWTKCEYAKL